jgi:hypothetical protein
MKRKLLLFIFLSVHLLQAQEQEQTVKNDNSILNKKNEVRLDIGQLIFHSRLQLAYERFLNKDFSTGISVIYFGDNSGNTVFYDSDFDRKIKIEPFVRYSISKSTDRFFYVESYFSLQNGNFSDIRRFSDGEYAFYEKTKSEFTNVAAGVAIGYKFYVKKHFCMDFNFGVSSFVYDKTNTEPIPKFGINAGYRF